MSNLRYRLSVTGGVALLASSVANTALAGAYVGSDQLGPDAIVHPSGYTGAGGTLEVNVCISPDTADLEDLLIPVQNVVATVNAMTPTTGNLISGGANDIPSNAVDAESALLHEVGHCIGLAHPNLASESGLTGAARDYTKTTRGGDGSFDLNDGADNVIGSSDDLRGDDVNLHWFRLSNNNPFTIDDPVDSTTYSRDLNLLPGNDEYAANAARAVANLLGLPPTETVMQQGQSFDEAQRTLGHDDVATLRYGESGLDEVAGTADDYTIKLVYVGVTNDDCNVQIVVNNQTGFASCGFGLSSVGNNGHFRITSGTVRLNDGTNWYYNQTPSFDPPNEAPSIVDIDNQIVDENAQLAIPILATDPNAGDALEFVEDGLPAFCGLNDNGDGTGSVDCAPLDGDAGNYPVLIAVQDDGDPPLFDQTSFTLVVNEVADSDGDGVADDQDNCTDVPNAAQRDTNGDGYGNLCDADLNNDCVTNILDLGLFRTVFFTTDGDADFNGDGTVNFVDLGILRTLFFQAPGPSGVTSVCDVR
ncbi:MAG: hypothetical protein AAF610_00020 [Pseudomonadota bacterium]